MTQYRRILLLADPAMCRSPAFDRAAWLAHNTGAELNIALFDRSAAIAAVALVNPDAARKAQDGWMSTRRAWLAEEALILRGKGVDVITEATWAHPVPDHVLKLIAEYKPDLVIKDVHHEPALRRTLLKPFDWQLMRECSSPILLVNTLASPAPRRIVAAVDVSNLHSEPGDFNNRIIKAASRLSIQSNAELHIAYAFDFNVNNVVYGAADFTEDGYERLRKMHYKAFMNLMEAQNLPADRWHFLYGSPDITIADFAAIGRIDVIVVGTHQRHGIDRMLLGSGAESIVDAAPCDVLVIKPGP